MGIRTARQLPWWRARRMRMRPPTSTRSRGVASVAMGSAVVSGAASVVASRAAANRSARAGASSRGDRWQGLDAERGGGICWNHWRFAEKASHSKGSAASPCGCQGN